MLSARGSARFLSRSLLRPEPNPPQAAAQKARAGPRTGITTPTRLLVSWPGAPSRPHKANLINRTGGADGFLFATFSFSPDWQAAGPLGYAFLGCTFYVAHWEQIPVLRLRAPLCTRSSMTPYSLIGREAAAARTHDLATSVGLLVFTSNLNGHGRKRS